MKKNKIIFLIRRSSDLDHLVPLINTCINKENIKLKLFNSELNVSIINHNIDPRLKFLKNKGLKYKIFNPIIFFNLRDIVQKYYFISKLNIFINIGINLFFSLRFFLILIFNFNSTYVIDHSIINNYKILINTKHFFKNKIISFPHAIMMHSGHNSKELNNKMFKYDKIFKNIDKVIFYNNNDLKFYKNLKNAKIMNSCLRYSEYWISNLKKIYPKINIKSKNIKVLFIEEKNIDNIDGERIEWINNNEVNKVIEYTSHLQNVDLFIKSHPSKITKDYRNLSAKYLDDLSTFQCIDFCDIVICSISSSIADCFILNKTIINLDYCHIFNSLIKKFNNDICVKDFDDFKNRLKFLISSNNFKNVKYQYDEIKKNLLLEHNYNHEAYISIFDL